MTEGQHKARVKFEGDSTSGSKAAKSFHKQIGRLEKRVEQLSRKQAKNAAVAKKQASAMERVEGGMQKASAAVSRMTSILGAAGLVGIAIQAVKAIDDLSKKSLELQNVSRNSKIDITAVREATAGLVDDFTLLKQSSAAVTLGVADTGEEFAEIAEVAIKLGAAVGKDATSSVEDFTTALARQSPMILDNLGLTLKQETANRKLAAQLGVNVNALTSEQRAQAFRNEALRLGRAATEDATLATDGYAAALQRSKVAAENAANEALGLDASIGEVTERIKKLPPEVEKLVHEMDTFGASRDEVVKMLKDVGIEGGNTARALDLLRKRFSEATIAAQKFAAEEERGAKINKEQRDEVNARIKQAEREIELIEAMGSKSKDAKDQILSLQKEIVGDRIFLLQKAGRFEEAEDLRHKQQVADVRALANEENKLTKATQKRKRAQAEDVSRGISQEAGAGARVGAPVSSFEQDALERGAKMARRRVEIANARGEGVAQARMMELEAEERLLNFQIKAAGQQADLTELKEQRDRVLFDKKLERIAEEEKREKEFHAELDRLDEERRAQKRKTFAVIQETTSGTASLASGLAATIQQSAEMGMISQRRAAAATATFKGVEALVLGFGEVAKAAAAGASYNIPQAILHSAAAAVAFTQSGLSFAQAAKLGAGGGGGGRASGAVSIPLRPPREPGARNGDLPSSGPPPGSGTSGQAPSAPQQPGVGTQIIVQGDVAGSVDKEFVRKMDRGLRDLSYQERRVS